MLLRGIKNSFQGKKKNTNFEPELGAEIMIHSHHLLCETSKLQHENAEPIMVTLKHWNMVRKGIKYRFQGKKRIPKLSKKWVFKKSETLRCCGCQCFIDQNSKKKLYNQNSMESLNKDIFWKLWCISFQNTQ